MPRLVAPALPAPSALAPSAATPRAPVGRWRRPAALAWLWLAAAAAPAQVATVYEEQGQLIRGSRNITAIGPEAFGDRINPYTGSLEFLQTDFSLPGNNALPVQVGRRMKTGSTFLGGGHFGDWELDIPHLKGVFAAADGWTVEHQVGADRFKRCSRYAEPASALTRTGGVWVEAATFWAGNHLVAPGGQEQELLLRGAGNLLKPGDGAAYPVVTKAGWQFRCLPALANGAAGEGFLAVAPDGVQYRFDWLVTRRHTGVRVNVAGSGAPRAREGADKVVIGEMLNRDEVLLLPTWVTDRFGNTVQYQYNPALPWQLQRIVASDGRQVDFSHVDTGPRIASATAHGRTWRYDYSGGGLVSVTQPDSAQWRFSGANLQRNPAYFSAPGVCDRTGEFESDPHTRTMQHPSGLVGQFTLKQTLHARSHVQPSCPSAGGHFTNWYPVYFLARSISRKSLSGPGMLEQAWTFDYGMASGGVLPCTGCSGTKTVVVTAPNGRKTRHTYGIRWREDEGQLLRLEEAWKDGIALRSTEFAYAAASAGPYPYPPGLSLQGRGDSGIEAQHRPQRSRVVSQQGATFQWQVLAFDEHARPKTVGRSSSLGFSRQDTQLYFDHLGLWVLGQPAMLREDLSATTVDVHEYDPGTAQLRVSHHFGLKTASYDYHPDGTLKTHYDAGGQPTTYGNYKRGLAQLITYADFETESATVDDWGQVRSHRNPAGSVTGYGYDAMGRLNLVTYPTGDAAAYHPTTLVFEPMPVASHGLPAGHWRQTVTTGNAVTMRHFDAMWRLRLSRSWDSTQEATTRQVVETRWDANGHKVFESQPQRDLAAVDGALSGTRWTHDRLGRVTTQVQDSELGPLTTSTAYLLGFKRRVTNPRLKATYHSFQAFDTPSEDTLVGITAPEGVTVSIARNRFGQPLSITRGGRGHTVVRSYVYDSHGRLCKTVEPETGATVQAYDAAGLVAWRASGLNLPNTVPVGSADACDHAQVPDTRKIHHRYNHRNRLVQTTHGDGSPGIGRNYTADGLPAQVGSAGATWTYHYNQRRQVVREELTYNGSTRSIDWGFDPHGQVSALRYPDGAIVTYRPNALGQPTQVSGVPDIAVPTHLPPSTVPMLAGPVYASGIHHHPNGAVAGYTLGNGIVHTALQNARGLPQTLRDAGVTHDVYTYDGHGNVLSIADQQDPLVSRTLGYDGLDRLVSAHGVWGVGSYTYDTVDNLRTSTVGARRLAHRIDPLSNRLSGLHNLDTGITLTMAHDANGNVVRRDTQRFVFDIANRMAAATGLARYSYDGHGRRFATFDEVPAGQLRQLQMYSQAGRLLWSQHRLQGETRHVYLGDKLIAETNTLAGTSYVHTDLLGSPVARTNAAGTVTSRTRYEPYGATAAGTNPTGVGFTGHVNEPETGLVYMQQRYYDPVAGLFLGADPMPPNASSGANFNRYAYSRNSPQSMRDPDGRCPLGLDGKPCEAKFVRHVSSSELRGRLNQIAQEADRNLVVYSGDRTPDGNHEANGDKNSPHLRGIAADVRFEYTSHEETASIIINTYTKQTSRVRLLYHLAGSSRPEHTHVDLLPGPDIQENPGRQYAPLTAIQRTNNFLPLSKGLAPSATDRQFIGVY